MPDRDGFYRVSSPWFVASLVVEHGLVVRAAPVLRWMVFWTAPWSLDRLLAYATRRHWTVDRLVADLTGVRVEPV